jgi:hypothetical protein
MRTEQNAVFSALQRAKPFIEENAAQLTSVVDLTAVRRRLDDVIARFTTHAFDQNVNDRDVKGESAKQRQLRLTLSTDVMRPVAEVARRNLRTVPEFKALQMPRHAVTGPAFIASAKGMADAAATHKDTLIERGLPADFLDQFQAALGKLEASMSDREQSRTRRMGATKGLAFQEQEGRSVLKVLDALVRRALRGNESLLGTWAGARAIHRRPGGPATTTSSTSTAVTPVETTVTAPTSPVAPAA